MKNFTRKVIGLLALVFTMSITTTNGQSCYDDLTYFQGVYQTCLQDMGGVSNELIQAESALNAANQEIYTLQSHISSLQSQLSSSFTQSDVDAAYSSGASSVTPEDGITQADVDAAYASGASSITPEDGITQADVDAATPLNLNIPLNLPEGWSLFGYTCPESVLASDGFSEVTDNIDIVKDEMGLTYLPSWNFNAIGDLSYGEGYQIKLVNEIQNFQFCQTLVYRVLGCMDPTMWNYNDEANTASDNCIPFIFGCTQLGYLEYNSDANTDNGSCLTLLTNACIDGQNGEACIELALDNGVDVNSIQNFEVYICLAYGDCQLAFENYIGELSVLLGIPYTCEDATACNYMENTTCSYPEMNCYDCDNILINSEDLGDSDPCNSLVLEQGGILVNSTETISWNFFDPNTGSDSSQEANDIPVFLVAVYDLENNLDNNAFTWFEAVAAVEALVIDGYDDWVLPSPAQLAIINQNLVFLNGNIANILPGNSYWSTEYSEARANYSVFYESQPYYSATSPKSGGYGLVRAVRNF